MYFQSMHPPPYYRYGFQYGFPWPQPGYYHGHDYFDYHQGPWYPEQQFIKPYQLHHKSQDNHTIVKPKQNQASSNNKHMNHSWNHGYTFGQSSSSFPDYYSHNY